MKLFQCITLIVLILSLISCGRNSKNTKTDSIEVKIQKYEEENETEASKRVDLINKGVGPISSITLSNEIDSKTALEGEEIFKKLCTACHRIDKKFIGPSPKGILKRRTPEWIMNMILDPEGMVKNDPLAKQLLIEFNGSPMANQSLSEDQARAVLESFRTLN